MKTHIPAIYYLHDPIGDEQSEMALKLMRESGKRNVIRDCWAEPFVEFDIRTSGQKGLDLMNCTIVGVTQGQMPKLCA